MGFGVQESSVCGAEVFFPLLLNVDESPLAAAKFEMLEAGEEEKFRLWVDHPMRMQVTPAGRLLSSTVTS